MDANTIVDLLNQLDRVSADSLENPTLDFKEWDRRGMNTAVDATIEHVVCMANGGGGTLILGVHDKKKGRKQAILGVPPEVDANTLRKSIYNKTSPQIMPSIKPFSVAEGTGRILVIEVQGDFPPYTDSQGRAKIRVGKECLPLTGPRLQNLMATRGNDDPTAREIVGKLGDLVSPVAMESLRGMAAQSAPNELLSLSDRDLLRSIGLINEKGYLRSAGLLLVGKPERIEEFFPSYQWAFLRMSSSTDYENVERDRTSLALALPKIESLITPYNPVTTVEQGLLHLEFRKYPTLAIREALMNAFAHANYRIPGVIQVQISEESLEIANPGGFIGGINESNFLRHAPVARNATLMSALISLSLANRNNLGMKRMYRAMLSDGKEPPIVKDVGESVRVVFLASDFSVPFRSFVQDRMKSGFLLSLEHLLVLQYILRHCEIDLATAAGICQQDVREARESLRRLVVSGALDCIRRDQATYWALAVQTVQLLKGSSVGSDAPLTKIQAAQLRVLSVLEERTGGIKASEVRQITGLSVADAKYLLRQMSGKSLIRSVGRGPGSIWYLVGDSVGESSPLDSPTIAVGEEKAPQSPTPSPTQFEKFTDAAHELGCDENDEAVDELMKRVASSPPPRKDGNSEATKEKALKKR